MWQCSKQTSRLIFEARSQILQNEGLTTLSSESAADEAGIDKGGLLYHFLNKGTLIEALFEYHKTNTKYGSIQLITR
jgi:hypothetical protein